jgi:uncharacterized protein
MDSASLASIAARHRVRLVLQFGSTAGGAVHAHSDLDLAVLLDEPVDLHAVYGDLRADLQALAPEREVDLAVLNRADPLLLKQIVQRCTLLYGRSRDLDELRIQAWKRYVDHRRFLEMERAYVDRRIGALPR